MQPQPATRLANSWPAVAAVGDRKTLQKTHQGHQFPRVSSLPKSTYFMRFPPENGQNTYSLFFNLQKPKKKKREINAKKGWGRDFTRGANPEITKTKRKCIPLFKMILTPTQSSFKKKKIKAKSVQGFSKTFLYQQTFKNAKKKTPPSFLKGKFQRRKVHISNTL